MLARFLGSVGILAAVATLSIAADSVEVRVERKGDAFLVRSEVPVAVNPRTAWQVLTDYNHLADFVPDMRLSRIVSEPGQRILLEQHGDAGFLFFRTEIRVVLEIEEFPPHRIVFRSVGGNVRRMQGEWSVVPDGEGIRLTYEAEIEPAFWVPPLLGDAILKGHIEEQISGVVKEMLRRHTEAISGHSISSPTLSRNGSRGCGFTSRIGCEIAYTRLSIRYPRKRELAFSKASRIFAQASSAPCTRSRQPSPAAA